MSTYPWNYGDILEAVDQAVPEDRTAFVHGERQMAWGDFTRRSNNLARALLDGGARPGDKIAFYLRNCPEYGEGIAAAFKARLTHVNVNYRYVDHELIYLMDNSDATVVIYGAEFAGHVREIQGALPGVHQWIEVDDGYSGREEATRYEHLVADGDGTPLKLERSPDDLLFLYTGGTTGMPKGVMWRQDDLWRVTGAGGNPRLGLPPSPDLDLYISRLGEEQPPVNLPLPPIMHGTGLLSAITAMTHGGTCVTLTGKSFDAEEALSAIDRHKVTATTIVGDAFARPMVETLDADPGRYDISTLTNINSSGVMWTRDIKAGLLRHNDNLVLADAFSSSEAIGLGASIMTRDAVVDVAKFTLGPSCKVFNENLEEVGVGESGMVGVTGFLPIGYFKDEEKSAKTFPVINGTRYSIPGDWVRVEEDGSLTLLGRGSNCINTGGEKVYPEEVEEALKHHESISDALVVGLPDDKWGQSVNAVISLNEGFALDEIALRDFIRKELAGYKLPKRILAKDDLERAPNGKANYQLIRAYAADALSVAI